MKNIKIDIPERIEDQIKIAKILSNIDEKIESKKILVLQRKDWINEGKVEKLNQIYALGRNEIKNEIRKR